MKISVLLSIAAVIFTFSNCVQAVTVPDPSLDLNSCLSQAETEAGQHRCYALDDCIKNQSANKEQLKECWFNAEQAYRVREGGGSHPGPSYVSTPGRGATSDVKTEIPDSDYSIKGGDHKGWDNATQGD